MKRMLRSFTNLRILRAIIFVFALSFFASSLAAADAPLLLMSNGATDYSIVIPGDAIPSEKYAAEELRDFLQQIGGARLEIYSEGAAPGGKRIYVGPGVHAKQILAEKEITNLGEEGFFLRTSGGDLIIAGGRTRGTLYGVYAFLEDKLGCRWYAVDASYIPKMEKIEIGALDERQTPAFEYREPFFSEAFDGDWAARNRVNGHTARLTEKHGGHIRYARFVHSFNELVPPDTYFDAHPEYYTEIDDAKEKMHTQLCVTEPDVLRIATEKTLQWLRDDPEARIVSVSQNDNMNVCKRPGDAAVEAAEGSPAGPLLQFVNSIADAAAAEFPNAAIDTLAYQYTENAPLHVKPRPNVIIRLCHMAPSCDTHPLDGCFWNNKYVSNVKAWTRISGRVYVWHYVTNFAHYIMPFPDVRAITQDIPFYYRHGVRGVFAQGSYQSVGGDMAALKSWLIAKLLWNPEAGSKALIEEFHRGYYGPAAPAMLDYFYALHKTTRDRTAHAHLYTSPDASFLPPDMLKYADTCFDRAEQAAADDPVIRDRVRQARLGITYVKLVAPQIYGWSKSDLQPGGAQDQFARLEKFKSDLAHFQITRIHETESIDQTLERMRGAIEKQIEASSE